MTALDAVVSNHADAPRPGGAGEDARFLEPLTKGCCRLVNEPEKDEVCLHSVGIDLDATVRLGLWQRTLARFFPWATGFVVVLPLTGYALVFGYLGGMAGAGGHVHLMQLTGWIMILLFFHLLFAPWRQFREAVEAGQAERARAALESIRRIVGINLVLGIITIAAGASGRLW